jgi:hypothetical protein
MALLQRDNYRTTVGLGNDSERGELRLPENKVLFNKLFNKQNKKTKVQLGSNRKKERGKG